MGLEGRLIQITRCVDDKWCEPCRIAVKMEKKRLITDCFFFVQHCTRSFSNSDAWCAMPPFQNKTKKKTPTCLQTLYSIYTKTNNVWELKAASHYLRCTYHTCMYVVSSIPINNVIPSGVSLVCQPCARLAARTAVALNLKISWRHDVLLCQASSSPCLSHSFQNQNLRVY